MNIIQMFGVDMVLFEIVDNEVDIGDYWSDTYSTPIKDTIQDVTLIQSSVTNNGFYATFTRKLITCDTE